jgi:metallophosphoesterase superfamily enzyme
LSNTTPVLAGLEAHPSGALWIPETRTALIADAHLGYSWAQRRRGELGPLADVTAKEKLLRLVADLQPRHLVFLGDLVHAPRPCAPEREWIEQLLTQLSEGMEITTIRGNLFALHGDRLAQAPTPEAATLILGHFHPSLAARDAAGASHRLPLFLANSRCIALPAFSPFARGFEVSSGLPEELQKVFGTTEIQAFAASATRVTPLGSLRQAIERMLAGTPNRPGHFRRRRLTRTY